MHFIAALDRIYNQLKMVSGLRCPAITINHAVVSDRPVPVCLSVCSKTAESTIKFGRRVLRYSPHMSLTNISPKVGVVTVT